MVAKKTPEEKAATRAAYRAANAEKARARANQWRLDNPERARENDRRKYAAKKDEKQLKNKAYYEANKAVIAVKNAEYVARIRATKPEQILNAAAKFRAANREKRNAETRAYAKTPKGRAAQSARVRNRQARKLQAMPAWADANAIREIYAKARAEGKEVDHIIPLRGKLVSGLHVPANLQLLAPEENRRKSNKLLEYA